MADYRQAFPNAEVHDREQLYAQPPDGWTQKLLLDGRRVVRQVHKVMLGMRTSQRRWQKPPVKQVEGTRLWSRCTRPLFVRERKIKIHVGDMLAIGLCESTKTLLQKLAEDMAMRWSMVTEKPQRVSGPDFWARQRKDTTSECREITPNR